MGISILELVLQKLRTADFLADVSFPGQKYPMISGPVAAVHIEKVDRANLSVTVEVSIICPASLGGTFCEVEALRATEVLRMAGATCIQNGCRYDGLAQVYVVSILATFICITDAESSTMGPGFVVYIQNKLVPFAVSFKSEQKADIQLLHAMGENSPVGILEGGLLWEFTLEELIPVGSVMSDTDEQVFGLGVDGGVEKESYQDCRWTSIRREYTRQGLRRTRTGIGRKTGGAN